MSHSRQTQHYQLPLFDDNDKPSFRGDFNEAMTKIDKELDEVAEQAGSESAEVESLKNRVNACETNITANSEAIANETNTARNNENAIQNRLNDEIARATNVENNLNSKIDAETARAEAAEGEINGEIGDTDISDIGDGTITGAIKELSEGGGGDVDKAYVDTQDEAVREELTTALEAETTRAEASEDEINGKIGDTDISGIGDGTITGAIKDLSEGGSGGGLTIEKVAEITDANYLSNLLNDRTSNISGGKLYYNKTIPTSQFNILKTAEQLQTYKYFIIEFENMGKNNTIQATGDVKTNSYGINFRITTNRYHGEDTTATKDIIQDFSMTVISNSQTSGILVNNTNIIKPISTISKIKEKDISSNYYFTMYIDIEVFLLAFGAGQTTSPTFAIDVNLANANSAIKIYGVK